ncbi:MAG: preprotein translocase subunit SecG [Chlorobi bacterium]|nr:preprotein translocase subunit SecG [Chlorobiota bacterium]
MYVLLTVFIFIAAILLILIVLVQNSKGGGLASNFSSSNQIMGVRKTTDFLEKATWTIALALLVFSIGASLTINRDAGDANKSAIEEQIQNAVDPGAIQNFPTTVPEKKENK